MAPIDILEISGLLAPGFFGEWSRAQATSQVQARAHTPAVESSQAVEGRSYLTQRKKSEAPQRRPITCCACKRAILLHGQRAKVPPALQRETPTASPASPHFVCPPRSHKIRAPAAVIASHRHQSPTALFLARPSSLPLPSHCHSSLLCLLSLAYRAASTPAACTFCEESQSQDSLPLSVCPKSMACDNR